MSTINFTKENLISQLESKKLDWNILEDDSNVLKITKSFEFKNFKEAMEFVNKVSELAEEQQHHPDIGISYNKVQLVLWTHDAGGVSEKDFRLATELSTLS